MDTTIDCTVEDITVVGKEDVESLQNVHKYLILLVPIGLGLVSVDIDGRNDRFMDRTGRRSLGIDHTRRAGNIVDHNRFVIDTGLEILCASNLRVPKVQHLIQQFVEQNKVFSYRLFRKGSTIILKDASDGGEELFGGLVMVNGS